MQPNEMADEAMGGEIDSSTGNAIGESTKSSKPMMEKRRRARINSSLTELKTILLGVMKKDTTRYAAKLEKADILEMTVKYLRKLEQQRATAKKISPEVVNKYKAGFNECRNEVMKFLSTHEGVTVEIRTRLLSHLGTCVKSLQNEEQEFESDEFIDTDPAWNPSMMHVDEPSSANISFMTQTVRQENDPDHQIPHEQGTTILSNIPKSATDVGFRGQVDILSTSTPSPTSSSEISSPNIKDDHVVFPCKNSGKELASNMPECRRQIHYPNVQHFQAPPSSISNTQLQCHGRRRIPLHYKDIHMSTTQGVPASVGENECTEGYRMPSLTNESEHTQGRHSQEIKIIEEPCRIPFVLTRIPQMDDIQNPSIANSTIYVHPSQTPVQYSPPYDQIAPRSEPNAKSPWRPWSPNQT